MLLRLLGETFRRHRGRAALGILVVALGAAIASGLLGVAADLDQRLSREMRAYGANILVTPRGQALLAGDSGPLLKEEDLPRLKTIFWRNNIVGFAPFLSLLVRSGDQPVALTGTWFRKELPPVAAPGRVREAGKVVTSEAGFVTGVRQVSPWWRVEGEWPRDSDPSGALVGAGVARRLDLKPGDSFDLTYQGQPFTLQVRGVLQAGGYEDDQVFVPLPVAQDLAQAPGGVGMVLVSALTMPREKLAPDIRDKRPEEMTPEEYEKWYCSPVIDAVVMQIDEVITGGEARAIRQISDAEGSFITRTQLLVLLVTLVSLAVSALGMMATMTTMVWERRGEVGLMKALGAEDGQVLTIFLAEAAVLGLLGGVAGYGAGLGLGWAVSRLVFDVAFVPNLVFLPLTLLLATGVALLGSLLPVRRTVSVAPIEVLR